MATGEPIPITPEQAQTMLTICKDVQIRIKANGMPDLDEDLAEMIEILEEATRTPPGEEIPIRKAEDPVKPIIDPARPPEKVVEHTKDKLKEEHVEPEKKQVPVPPKIITVAEAKATEGKTHTHKHR